MGLKKPTAPPKTEAEAPHADLAGLKAALAAPEAGERRRAARELGAFPEAGPLLCAHLAREPAASVRAVILTTLIRLKSPAVVEGLLPLLRSEDSALRNAAIEALQEMPMEVEPHVADLLADPDSDVRILAVNMLSLLPHPKAPDWLAEVVAREAHINVCAAAVDGLAEIGNERAIAPLQALAARFPEVPFIRFAAAAAIRRIGGS
ncbi:HEAT repeat domain-containing protein [Methylobacterium brachiatum]|uniref:HEAT repeat domain-containing protein n=1 Tax=Methylobacterium brachiatum TaxID=269660 RepID=A0AAJ1TN78_9HYPH|nr:HEAT repeat domain-containing protein [Methylobacterium brachiatum]MCB4803267.1 HEAT repeat domain-containing protein [Methylobacterium brachiatum]MDF2600504.1 repeat-containing lyase [Methylobacterium brachiatum]MDH2308746.1 HEAT repeat domain-containing protein [Methylobacterium brachiatum]MDQ0543995.1 HEAT repeat protein [Methylobacterium brachiatum]SFI43126.1 HEAT repeat-containing protein [Methylobacterium brachiatum]